MACWPRACCWGFRLRRGPWSCYFFESRLCIVAGWFVAQWGRRGWRQWGLVGTVGCGLVVGAVACRNYLVGGEWLLTTSSAGMNFYVGNHPEANGIYAQVDFLPSAEPDLEREAFIREAEARTGRELTPAQASRYWLVAGLRFAVENPLAYLALQGRKLYMFWNGVEAQNNLSLYLARDFVPLLRWCVLGWGLVAPLAVVGWATSRRSPLLDLYLASYLAACLLFFTSSEYRLPVVPVILLYAACWLANAASWATNGAHRRLLGSCLLVALVALPINYRDAGAERLTRKAGRLLQLRCLVPTPRGLGGGREHVPRGAAHRSVVCSRRLWSSGCVGAARRRRPRH